MTGYPWNAHVGMRVVCVDAGSGGKLAVGREYTLTLVDVIGARDIKTGTWRVGLWFGVSDFDSDLNVFRPSRFHPVEPARDRTSAAVDQLKRIAADPAREMERA